MFLGPIPYFIYCFKFISLGEEKKNERQEKIYFIFICFTKFGTQTKIRVTLKSLKLEVVWPTSMYGRPMRRELDQKHLNPNSNPYQNTAVTYHKAVFMHNRILCHKRVQLLT